MFQAFSRAFIVAWLLLVMPVAAYGHAAVVETVPADGALLEAAPDQVVIRFNESVTLVAAQILNAAGDNITPADAASVQGDELRIALPLPMAEGSFIASYRVMSADSHPVGGSIVFSVVRVSQHVTAPLGAPDDRGWMAAMVVVRTILYVGIMGGAGGVLFLLVVRPTGLASRATRRIAAIAAAIGSLAALLAIGVQGGLLLDGPVSNLMDAVIWRLGLASGFGTTAIVAFTGLALVSVGFGLNRKAFRVLAYLGAALALTSFALSGHVVTAASRWITIPVLLTHTTAVAFWIGSLLPLHQAIARLGANAAPIMQRFSRTGVVAVAALMVVGLVIVLLQVPSIGGLITTTYGLILLAKLGLVTGLLGLAVINKMRFTPALAAGDPWAAVMLRRSIAAEMLFASGILIATAMLGTTPPPRVLEEASAKLHAGHIHTTHEPASRELSVTIIGAGGSAEVVLGSDHAGINAARINLLDGAGRPLRAQEVTFIAANSSAGVQPFKRAAEASGPGSWQVEHLLLVPSGSWSIRIDALVSDFEKVDFETIITLR